MSINKQIIVDGVDISKCKHCGSQGNCIIYGNLACYRFPDCYFKQLARKTQEYELLVRTNKIHIDTLDQLNNKYIDLEQECEKLKRKVELMMDCPDCKVDEYKKALEEIREIIVSEDVSIRPKLYDFEQDNKILDIINKVKG